MFSFNSCFKFLHVVWRSVWRSHVFNTPSRCPCLPGYLSFTGNVRILRLAVRLKILIGRFETFRLTFPCHSL